jgi:hypothetical protein
MFLCLLELMGKSKETWLGIPSTVIVPMDWRVRWHVPTNQMCDTGLDSCPAGAKPPRLYRARSSITVHTKAATGLYPDPVEPFLHPFTIHTYTIQSMYLCPEGGPTEALKCHGRPPYPYICVVSALCSVLLVFWSLMLRLNWYRICKGSRL